MSYFIRNCNKSDFIYSFARYWFSRVLTYNPEFCLHVHNHYKDFLALYIQIYKPMGWDPYTTMSYPVYIQLMQRALREDWFIISERDPEKKKMLHEKRFQQEIQFKESYSTLWLQSVGSFPISLLESTTSLKSWYGRLPPDYYTLEAEIQGVKLRRRIAQVYGKNYLQLALPLEPTIPSSRESEFKSLMRFTTYTKFDFEEMAQKLDSI